MQKSKIEWCDMTWNPVTGCLHDCEYCYARGIAKRFGDGKFEPDIHFSRLNDPQKVKKPQDVFVCSMADLFGEWVSDKWIETVFKACEKAPHHRYIFLTKNPARYMELANNGKLPQRDNFWYGTTITKCSDSYFYHYKRNTFLSVEPLMSDFDKATPFSLLNIDWVIIGAETGNRKGKVIPQKEWIINLINISDSFRIPKFMKNNLADIWEEPLIQQFPWKK